MHSLGKLKKESNEENNKETKRNNKRITVIHFVKTSFCFVLNF